MPVENTKWTKYPKKSACKSDQWWDRDMDKVVFHPGTSSSSTFTYCMHTEGKKADSVLNLFIWVLQVLYDFREVRNSREKVIMCKVCRSSDFIPFSGENHSCFQKVEKTVFQKVCVSSGHGEDCTRVCLVLGCTDVHSVFKKRLWLVPGVPGSAMMTILEHLCQSGCGYLPVCLFWSVFAHKKNKNKNNNS